jgi:hypothetical protein
MWDVVEKVALGQVSLRVLWFSHQYIPMGLHTCIIWRMKNTPTGGHSSETQSHPINIEQYL